MSKILLVEDDASLRSLLTLTLTRASHQVTEARDGQEALRLFPEVRPDLVITDLIMPEMDGIDLLVQLRDRDTKTAVIVISGGGRVATEKYMQLARQFGEQCALLVKPFTSSELLQAVATACPGN